MKEVNGVLYRNEDIVRVGKIEEGAMGIYFDVDIKFIQRNWLGFDRTKIITQSVVIWYNKIGGVSTDQNHYPTDLAHMKEKLNHMRNSFL